MKLFTHNNLFVQVLAPVVLTGTGLAVAPVARVSMTAGEYLTILLSLGAIAASTTITFKLTQSDAASSGNTKDIDGAALASIITAGAAKTYAITVKSDQLDHTNGYAYVGVSYLITDTKTVGACMLGVLGQLKNSSNAAGLTQDVLATN